MLKFCFLLFALIEQNGAQNKTETDNVPTKHLTDLPLASKNVHEISARKIFKLPERNININGHFGKKNKKPKDSIELDYFLSRNDGANVHSFQEDNYSKKENSRNSQRILDKESPETNVYRNKELFYKVMEFLQRNYDTAKAYEDSYKETGRYYVFENPQVLDAFKKSSNNVFKIKSLRRCNCKPHANLNDDDDAGLFQDDRCGCSKPQVARKYFKQIPGDRYSNEEVKGNKVNNKKSQIYSDEVVQKKQTYSGEVLEKQRFSQEYKPRPINKIVAHKEKSQIYSDEVVPKTSYKVKQRYSNEYSNKVPYKAPAYKEKINFGKRQQSQENYNQKLRGSYENFGRTSVPAKRNIYVD